jgi:hypothetical protein
MAEGGLCASSQLNCRTIGSFFTETTVSYMVQDESPKRRKLCDNWMLDLEIPLSSPLKSTNREAPRL